MDPITEHSITLTQHLNASVERVFDAWRNPEHLAAWAWGALGHRTHAEVDFRVGGAYRASATRPDGEVWSFHGTYTAIEPDARIEHTVAWDAPMGYDPAPEILEARFTPDGEGTIVTLTHTGLQSERSAAVHREGWENVMQTLATYLAPE